MDSRPLVLMACGSYNPPTPMHMRMFEIAKDHFRSLNVPVVGGIMSPVHDAYGKKDLASASHRYAMVQLAAKSSNWIRVSDWEITRDGWTKTRFSLQYHQNYINAYLQAAAEGALQGGPPSWMPHEVVGASRIGGGGGIDEIDGTMLNPKIDNGNDGEGPFRPRVQVKLLCGADLLESFATPGLWADDDLEAILGEHGIIVITRSGSNPEKFIYDSDILTQYKRNITLITNWVPNEVSSTLIRRLLRRGESVKYLIDDNVLSYIKTHQLYGSVDRTAKYLTVFDPLQPFITTPSPDDIVMKSPSEFRMQKDDPSTKSRASISAKIMNYLIGVDEIDKNDVYTSSSAATAAPAHSRPREKRSRLTNKVSASLDVPPKPFCDSNRGSTDSLENMHALPRKSVKVITDVSGVHKIINNKKKVRGNSLDITDSVFVFIDSKLVESKSVDVNGVNIKIERPLCVEIDNLKIGPEGNSDGGGETPVSPTRSYDEVVKFIFSEHGIQVISDRETIV